MTKQYKPRGPTNTTRAIVFFALNPEEELTHTDMMSKLDIGYNTALNLLRDYVETRWIDHKVIRGHPVIDGHRRPMSVYSAGPELLKFIGRTR